MEEQEPPDNTNTQTDEQPPLEVAMEPNPSHALDRVQSGILNHLQPQVELGEEFPVERLTKLDEQLSRPKWVVPVRPGDDLEMLVRHSIKLCREGEGRGSNILGLDCIGKGTV